MIHDKVVFGGLIGVLANLAMNIIQFPVWKLKMIMHPLSHYASSMFMDPETLHHTLLGSVVSFLADYVYGAFWGILFVYLIYLTGKHACIIKGLIFGAFLWFFSFGALRSLAVVKLREVFPGDVLYYLLFHLIFGLALGLLTKKFGEHVFEKD